MTWRQIEPMTLPDRANKLQAVRELVENHANPVLAQWFADGVDRFLRGDEPALCLALGLRGAGVDSIKLTIARERRNHHLCQAFALVNGDLAKLEQAISRFRRGPWRWCSRDDTAPDNLDGLQAELFSAFSAAAAAGLAIPASRKQLDRITTPD